MTLNLDNIDRFDISNPERKSELLCVGNGEHRSFVCIVAFNVFVAVSTGGSSGRGAFLLDWKEQEPYVTT